MPLTAEQQLQLTRSGLGNLLGLISGGAGVVAPGQSPLNQAASGIQAAGSANQLSGLLGGPTLSGGYGSALGGLGAAVGLGAGIYDIVNNPNLSTKQKAGHAGDAAANAIVSATVPYGWLYAPTKLVGQQMEKSGSPQIRAGGRQILAPLLPVMGLESVLAGDKSPRAAFNDMVTQIKEVPVLGKPAGSILNALGIGTPPTTGTMFRREIASMTRKDPKLKSIALQDYNITPDKYNAFSADTRSKAQALGKLFASHSTKYKDNPQAYENQVTAMLLNGLGDGVTDVAKQYGL